MIILTTLFFIFRISNYSKMSQLTRKRQHLDHQEENGNGNELSAPELKMAALEAKNGVLSVENEVLRGKLKETEQKAQMAKNELEKIIQQQKNPQNLEALLANVIAILKEQQVEKTTSSSHGLKLNLELEIPQKSPDHHRRVPLPLELNCQIFECLKFGIQRKFIGGLGRGIYGIFRQKVLTKSKRLGNPGQNGWEVSNTRAIISSNGLVASDNRGTWLNMFAKKGFPITGKLCRPDNFPGTILYYFEVTEMSSSWMMLVGLSSGNIPDGTCIGEIPNSYAIAYGYYRCRLSGNSHDFELPNGATKPQWNGQGDVVGCGLLLNSENEVSIFFTGNGILMGKQIPINPTVDPLYPTVSIFGHLKISVEANFGNDSTKPFKYDIQECPGMVSK